MMGALRLGAARTMARATLTTKSVHSGMGVGVGKGVKASRVATICAVLVLIAAIVRVAC